MYWLCFKTNTRKEFLAKNALLSEGFKVLLPYYMKTIKHARKISQVPHPFFPSYGFLLYNGKINSLNIIRKTRGIKYYLHHADGNPQKVPLEVIKYLLTLQKNDGSFILDVDRFKKGDEINILEGGLSGMSAIFLEKIDEVRVKLLVKLLGRVNTVYLNNNMIEHI